MVLKSKDGYQISFHADNTPSVPHICQRLPLFYPKRPPAVNFSALVNVTFFLSKCRLERLTSPRQNVNILI